MIYSTEGQPINLGQICFTYCDNFMFHGVLSIDSNTAELVIRNLRFDISFEVSKLKEIHVFTGLDFLSLPKDDLNVYLRYLGQLA